MFFSPSCILRTKNPNKNNAPVTVQNGGKIMKNTKITLTIAAIIGITTLTGCSGSISVSAPDTTTPVIVSEAPVTTIIESIPVPAAEAPVITEIVTESNVVPVLEEPIDISDINIDFDYRTDETTYEEYGVITASANNNICWTYETIKTEVAECCRIEMLNAPEGMVCINEGGTITALNSITGDILWQNYDYQAGGTISCIGDDGTLYISSYSGPAFMAISRGGNTLVKVDSFADYFWPYDMSLENDMATIYFDSDDNASVTINVTDFSYEIN